MTGREHALSRGIFIPAALTLIGLVVLVSLGVWQLERLSWKENLIAMAEQRANAPAAPLPPPLEWAPLDPADYEYRSVRVEGRFRHGDEVHVYTVLSEARGPAGGPGWWVVTPLELADGAVVLVNRGFVPDGRKEPATRPGGQVDGEVVVEGLMRGPVEPGPFTPEPDVEANQWFHPHAGAIAEALRLPGPVAPFIIDATASAPGGLPQGGETRLTFRNDHLGYALTWFGLALTLVGVFAVWLRGRLAGARTED